MVSVWRCQPGLGASHLPTSVRPAGGSEQLWKGALPFSTEELSQKPVSPGVTLVTPARAWPQEVKPARSLPRPDGTSRRHPVSSPLTVPPSSTPSSRSWDRAAACIALAASVPGRDRAHWPPGACAPAPPQYGHPLSRFSLGQLAARGRSGTVGAASSVGRERRWLSKAAWATDCSEAAGVDAGQPMRPPGESVSLYVPHPRTRMHTQVRTRRYTHAHARARPRL